MQSLSKYNKDSIYSAQWICLVNGCSFERQRGISIVNAFQKIIFKCGEAEAKGQRKPNKIWVDQGGEFYSNLFKRFF